MVYAKMKVVMHSVYATVDSLIKIALLKIAQKAVQVTAYAIKAH